MDLQPSGLNKCIGDTAILRLNYSVNVITYHNKMQMISRSIELQSSLLNQSLCWLDNLHRLDSQSVDGEKRSLCDSYFY